MGHKRANQRHKRHNADKQSAMERDYHRKAKSAGDVRYDEEFERFEKERVAAQFFDDDDRAVEIRRREVQVGPVKGGKMSIQRDDGTVVVSSAVLRKERGESWGAYKTRVPQQLSAVPAMMRRSANAEAKEIYLEEIEERLRSLRLVVLPRITIGSAHQRRRLQRIKEIQRELQSESSQGGSLYCRIVPDGGKGPVVIFPYRWQHLPPTFDEFANGQFFVPEVEYALQKYDAARVPAVVHGGEHQSLLDLTGIDVSGFTNMVGQSSSDAALAFVYDHWRGIAALCAELHAFSLVRAEDRTTYVVSRSASAALMLDLKEADVLDFFLKLMTIPAVASFVASFRKMHSVGAIPDSAGLPEVVIGSPQGLLDFLGPSGLPGLSPGTALHGIVALGAAAYVLANRGSEPISLSGVGAYILRHVARLPKVETAQDAVEAVLRYFPIVLAGVSAALACGSINPILLGHDSAFMRYVDVATAFKLRKQGKYDPALFADDGAFLRGLLACKNELEPLVKKNDLGATRIWGSVNDMLAQVRCEQGGKWRKAPFAFALHGRSGIGKTDILHKLLAVVSREMYGRPSPPDKIYTRQSFDSYWSGYKEDMEVCVFDDVANAKAAPGTSLPNQCWPLVEAINNSPLLLNMADVESKGNVAFCSQVVAVTSNVRDLCASQYSNEPVSVLRRFNVFIEPTVRPQYVRAGTTMLDPAKVPSRDEVPLPDLWTFRVTTAIRRAGALASEVDFVDVEGFPRGGDIFTLMAFLRARCVQHKAQQDALSFAQKERSWLDVPIDDLRAMAAVYAEGHPEGVAAAPLAPVVGVERAHQAAPPGIEFSDDSSALEAGDSASDSEGDGDGNDFLGGLAAGGLRVRGMRPQSYSLDMEAVRRTRDLVVTRVGAVRDVAERRAGSIVESARDRVDTMIQRCDGFATRVIGDAACSMAYSALSHDHFWLAFAFCLIVYAFSGEAAMVLAQLAMGLGVLYLRTRHIRHMQRMTPPPISVFAIGAGAALLTWCMFRRRNGSEVGAFPSTFVQTGSAQGAVEYEGVKNHQEPLRKTVPEVVSTATMSQCEDWGKKSRFAMMASIGGAADTAGVGVLFPITKGLYVTNKHIVEPLFANGATGLQVVVFPHSGASQAFTTQRSDYYFPSERLDLAFVQLHGPSEKDLSERMLPDAWYASILNSGGVFPVGEAKALMTRRRDPDSDGVPSLCVEAVRLYGSPYARLVEFNGVAHESMMFETGGLRTFRGDCGSPVLVSAAVAGNHATVIAGIHSGVVYHGGKHYAVIAPVTKRMVANALAHFTKAAFQSAPALIGQPAELTLVKGRINPALPRPVGGYVTPLGVLQTASGINPVSQNSFRSCLQRGLFYSSVDIDSILGRLGHEMPRDTTNVRHFVTPLQQMDVKREDYDCTILDAAAADYLASVRALLRNKLPSRPYSLFEACNMADGLPPLPMNTAAGFGHRGSKDNYVVEACVRDCATPGCRLAHPAVGDFVVLGRTNVFPTDEILAEVADLEGRLLRGESNLAIFKASLKDEPVSLGKDKIRAFYVGMFALNLLVRRYLMPMLCALQKCRGYECCVGMSVATMDWENLQSDLEEYDENLRLGGDYKSFDLSTHEVLLDHFYDTIRELCVDAKWPARDVAIVKALGANLARPVYIMLGEVFAVRGSNPSGVAVTTHANSGVNSLIHRYAFYSANRSLLGVSGVVNSDMTHFTRSVRLRTYGDDVIGSVRTLGDVKAITNVSVRDAARAFGMTYGPIDKTSVDLPLYYDKEEVEFLKCSSVHVPELGHRIGCIALGSIRKSVAFERGRVGFSQRLSTLQSALRLYFPTAACVGGTGREAYARLREVFARGLAHSDPSGDYDACLETLPTYDDVLESLRGNTDTVPVDETWVGFW